MSNNPFDIEIYESPTCPPNSFYFVDNQTLGEVKKFDKWFEKLQKLGKRQAIFNSADVSEFVILERDSRQEGQLE